VYHVTGKISSLFFKTLYQNIYVTVYIYLTNHPAIFPKDIGNMKNR